MLWARYPKRPWEHQTSALGLRVVFNGVWPAIPNWTPIQGGRAALFYEPLFPSFSRFQKGTPLGRARPGSAGTIFSPAGGYALFRLE